MGKLKIVDNLFIKDEKPFFWLADTIWSMFTNMTEDELEEYLRLRKSQGFNVLQINILPQWDRSNVACKYHPFEINEGAYDYSKPMNDSYFEHAQKMLSKVVEYGFTPALVVLWSNYVPGTWASRISESNIMPFELLDEYCEKVVECFDQFAPIYVISGDTDLDNEEAIKYYEFALNKLKSLSPDSLKTMHIKGRYTYLPETIVDGVDFYMYQSGHNGEHLEKCYTMPQEFFDKYPRKPLLNSEPCYEQMGFSGQKYGRFNQKDVRRAAWMSVLSGANAGITYGAHGVWNWKKTSAKKNSNIGEGFDISQTWLEALQYPGAWDYGFLKNVIERFGNVYPDDRINNQLRYIEHVIDENGNDTCVFKTKKNPEIRMASTIDKRCSLIYAPFNTEIMVQEDLRDCTVKIFDMQTRHIADGVISFDGENSHIKMSTFTNDILILIERGVEHA